MQDDTYKLLNSMSDEDLKLIENGDYSPLEKIKNKTNENNQQPQQPMGNRPGGMNPNQGMAPGASQNLYQNDGMARNLGNLASGVASGVYDNVRGVVDLAGLNLKPRQFGGDAESNSFGAGKFIGDWGTPFLGALKAGKAIGKAAPGLKKVASWLPEALGVGAVGAAVHPGTINERLLTGAGEAALVPAFHGLVKGYRAAREGAKGAKQGISNARENLKYATNDRFKEGTQKTLEEVLGVEPFTKQLERESIHGGINQTARSNLKESHDKYRGVIDKANEMGYDGIKKKIAFNDLHEGHKAAIDANRNLSHLFDNFLKKPSFSRAHRLQSGLGRAATEYKNPLNDQVTKDMGKLYQELQNKMLQSIKSSLSKNGDTSVLSAYEKASHYYKEKVVPYYHSTHAIVNISRSNPKHKKYNYTTDIIGALLTDTGELSKVRGALTNDTQRAILKKLLTGAEDNPKLLGKRIKKIKAGGEIELVNKEELKKIEDFLKTAKGLEIVREFVNKNKNKFLVGAGGASIYAGYKAAKSLISKED